MRKVEQNNFGLVMKAKFYLLDLQIQKLLLRLDWPSFVSLKQKKKNQM